MAHAFTHAYIVSRSVRWQHALLCSMADSAYLGVGLGWSDSQLVTSTNCTAYPILHAQCCGRSCKTRHAIAAACICILQHAFDWYTPAVMYVHTSGPLRAPRSQWRVTVCQAWPGAVCLTARCGASFDLSLLKSSVPARPNACHFQNACVLDVARRVATRGLMYSARCARLL